MYRVYLVRKNITLCYFDTEEKAENFCEMWGWTYDGTEGSGTIGFEEVNVWNTELA